MTPDDMPPIALPKRVSLVAQCVHSLRTALAAGYWIERMPGERELCQTLEVSRPTLRAALAEMQREGAFETTARVRRRIAGQTLAGQSSLKTVAVLLPAQLRSLAPTIVLIIDALRDHLSQNGWTMRLHVSPACFTRRPERALAKATARTPAAVWLLITSVRPMLEWFVRRGLRCLVAGTGIEGIALPFVDADHYAAARHAGALLLRKGHRRIAIVRHDEYTIGDNESERGLREVLSTEPAITLRILRHHGRSHLLTLLDRCLRSAAPPTAYFVLRSSSALTVTMHLLHRRQRVPQDVAVISRDDEVYLSHTSPLITRYAFNVDLFARHISRLVRTIAETGTLNPHVIRLMPKFIAGETV